MGRLKSISRRITKGKNRMPLKMEKRMPVRNGYLKITIPFKPEFLVLLDDFTEYAMSFADGNRSMENPENAAEWEVKIKSYINAMFGKGSYYKIFGDNIASFEDVGNFAERLSGLMEEFRKELGI